MTSPDIVIVLTDQERAAPPYETVAIADWRRRRLASWRWFDERSVTFDRHYTGSLACVPSRPTLFTGHFPTVHQVTQTDGLGKDADDSGMRWLRPGEVPTIGNWLRTAGYETHYIGKWHISHADLVDEHTGTVLATNDDDGSCHEAAIDRYLAADPLDPFGFGGWIGPEPHGGSVANSGTIRDPLFAARAEAWLDRRAEARAAGDSAALRPFLLVVSFVNPHDIVLFPPWLRQDLLPEPEPGVPAVPPAPTATEDLLDKPLAQRAFRDAYPTGYAPIADGVYDEHAHEYRRLYLHYHAVVDDHVGSVVDAVERLVARGGESGDAVIVRSSDHGDLLGAHGGLHQKWWNLYDEATRVPCAIARIGTTPTVPRRVDAPTSHVDLVPTILGIAGIDTAASTADLSGSFDVVGGFPGRDLSPVLDGDHPIRGDVYLETSDHILDGDTGASAVARALGLGAHPPDDMRISVPHGMGDHFDAVVGAIDGTLAKLACTHGSDTGDEWELYDLIADPAEADNLTDDPSWATRRAALAARLDAARRRAAAGVRPAP